MNSSAGEPERGRNDPDVDPTLPNEEDVDPSDVPGKHDVDNRELPNERDVRSFRVPDEDDLGPHDD
ncbi:hypothetical protein DFQ14_113138 [Halopolyspora algeriensis]|uniref:Uncharacterized protein n=1 Tax=Halopolyspora algeriensis TaxID=1500506 RepID=A0A368VM04_9ACTN|nr:hypothetical protein [Halopolyspora algeriensis]RCW40055.1 hypothetical protein DFQ14_113138 [Halopolyspora algeriensis]TQM56796.1 hypothetical protein FHU43_1611 [Halopolyspora algeriensis]